MQHCKKRDGVARAGDILSWCSQCSQWALRQWELPGNGNEQDSYPCVLTQPQPAMGYPAPFAPPELQVAPKGVTTEKVVTCSHVPCPHPFSQGTMLPTCSIPQEPLTYSAVQNQYLHKFSPMVPTAPGEFEGDCSPQEERTPPSPIPPGFTRLVGTDSNHLGTEIRGGRPDPISQRLQHQQPPHQPLAHR